MEEQVQPAAHDAYRMYANAKSANGTTNQFIEDLYNYMRIEIERLEKVITVKDAGLIKAEITITRLEAGLVVPASTVKRKA